MNKLNLTLKILATIAFISLFSATALIAFDFFKTREHFPPHSFIGKVEVSGLKKPEAIKKLEATHIADAFEPMVYFNASGETFAYSPNEIGVYIKAEESIDNAYNLSHKESYIKELRKRLTRQVLLFPIILDAYPGILDATLQDIASKVESVAQDAAISLDEKSGAYHITQDFPGRRLDVEQTMKDCRLRLNDAKNVFPLALDYYEFPRVTEDALRAAPPVYQIASFITYYGKHDSRNRIHNIKLIASWLNNTLLLPDEEFSLVKSVGKFTPDRGFKEAYVIIGGKLEPQYGGGTCQIGTTLYNVAALADLKILSRRNHSLYFNIYPFGRDATVYPGSADLKFMNDSGNPILVKTKATNRYLRFTLFGTPTGKKVVFSKPKVFALTKKGFVRSSKWKVLRSSSPFRTIVTRKVFDEEGELLEKEEIKSYYRLYGDGSNVEIIRKEPR
ncbi:MAG: VanW family protein [Candidatus Saganbacteria bacterium]|nr:VanW family protein [Candidatus Saganbacteria bacterium]